VPEKGDTSGVDEADLGVAGALHDVSNALTVLLGWVTEARATGAQAVEHALAMIEQQARLARDLARRAIGAAPSSSSEAVVDEVVADALEALAVESQRARVALERDGSARGARIRSAEQVWQILTNLVMNALAYAPGASKIILRTDARDRVVVLEVEDEGPGVEPSRARSIFQGDSTREGGAGVGLRHARAMARAVGGDLALMPQPLTKGARFRLTWPRADVVAPSPPLSKPAPPILQGTRILVLEDDSDVALLLQTALGARGATVTVATSAVELAQAADAQHDAALIDLSPIASDIDGALDGLRRRSPDLALVFISGSATGVPESKATEGARWVRKPFEIGEVVAALTESRPAPALKKE
jgi:CheY-like chemotaxis protein